MLLSIELALSSIATGDSRPLFLFLRDTHIWYVQYIPRNMHTVFALLCFVVVILWLIFPYPSGLLNWHCGNLTIAPVPAKQPWWIWINTSCEFIMNDCITTTKQSTTKPCAYFLGYTVYIYIYVYKYICVCIWCEHVLVFSSHLRNKPTFNYRNSKAHFYSHHPDWYFITSLKIILVYTINEILGFKRILKNQVCMPIFMHTVCRACFLLHGIPWCVNVIPTPASPRVASAAQNHSKNCYTASDATLMNIHNSEWYQTVKCRPHMGMVCCLCFVLLHTLHYPFCGFMH